MKERSARWPCCIKVPIVTTITGASAVVKAIAELRKKGWDVKPLQEYGQSRTRLVTRIQQMKHKTKIQTNDRAFGYSLDCS